MRYDNFRDVYIDRYGYGFRDRDKTYPLVREVTFQVTEACNLAVMVTHDRYFLDSVSNRIVELDKGILYSYSTNYSGFLELKAQREAMAEASNRKRESILRVELEWVKRGARARSTKQKARLERYEELKNTAAPVKDESVELGSMAMILSSGFFDFKNSPVPVIVPPVPMPQTRISTLPCISS